MIKIPLASWDSNQNRVVDSLLEREVIEGHKFFGHRNSMEGYVNPRPFIEFYGIQIAGKRVVDLFDWYHLGIKPEIRINYINQYDIDARIWSEKHNKPVWCWEYANVDLHLTHASKIFALFGNPPHLNKTHIKWLLDNGETALDKIDYENFLMDMCNAGYNQLLTPRQLGTLSSVPPSRFIRRKRIGMFEPVSVKDKDPNWPLICAGDLYKLDKYEYFVESVGIKSVTLTGNYRGLTYTRYILNKYPCKRISPVLKETRFEFEFTNPIHRRWVNLKIHPFARD